MDASGAPAPRWGFVHILPVTLVVLCALTAMRSAPTPAASDERATSGPQDAEATRDALVTFRPRTAAQLTRVLDAAWAGAENQGEVPGIAPLALPEDMDVLDPETRKRTFLRSVVPHLLDVNREIDTDRQALLGIASRLREGAALTEGDRAFVETTCRRYGVSGAEVRLAEGAPAAAVDLLLEHVDVVPLRLALAQAVVESGWGASRLASRDNSLFGQSAPSGAGRAAARPGPDGLWYARFATLRAGVEAYVRNLNRFEAYRAFRQARAAMRRNGKPLDALRLAGGLLDYSELRERYVAKVRRVIRSKDIADFAGSRLAEPGANVPAREKVQEILALAEGAPAERPDA